MLRRLLGQGQQSIPHGILALLTANDWWRERRAARGPFVMRVLIGPDDHVDAGDGRMCAKDVDGPAKQGARTQLAELLRDAASSALAFASCDNQYGNRVHE